MDLKHLSIIFFIIALIWTSLYIFGSHGVPLYSSELTAIDKGYNIVYSNDYSPIRIYAYSIYPLHCGGNTRKDIVIDYHVKNLTYASLPIVNIRIKYFLSNYTPIEPPSPILTYMDYVSLYEGKVNPILVGMGLEDKYVVLENICSKYLIIIVVLSVRQDIIVDLTKYVPPLTYYPSSPPRPDIFINVVKRSQDNPYYRTMILYLAEKIYENTGSLSVFQEYVLTSQNIRLSSILIVWVLSITFIEAYDYKFVLKLFRELTYKAVISGSYLRRKLRKLLKYMVRQRSS
ncbi:hypothetical protein [Staphylothermus hellenicus]|uniref:Uncharacterized protein n=1 Tax=Staphylothermus hellenicus (strain DSM 12710 / JCM 10830 / BK20S6-10-b1 / P8) TaxID=591019 RepID=D7D9A9_STAHD|nr:hypothetical protein [Staphylothermus hellenicus]ADI32355.1 hypothetical protein Shell_1257 [Staphylothermus hellenicus DSM 12710]